MNGHTKQSTKKKKGYALKYSHKVMNKKLRETEENFFFLF